MPGPVSIGKTSLFPNENQSNNEYMITKSNLLLTRAAMTLLMMVFTTVGAWALEYYVDAATEGNAGETVENLFDGDVNTKWCVTNELPIYVEFHTDVPIPPTEYVLTTANDCTSNTGRNPKSWALYGKVSENDEWVLNVMNCINNRNKWHPQKVNTISTASASSPPIVGEGAGWGQ